MNWIRDFSVQGDGLTNDTLAIQHAIDETTGTLCFTPGRYLCGPLYLHSNLTLHLEAGAELMQDRHTSSYPADSGQQRYDYHSNMDRCWIYAHDSCNLTLCGEGLLNGQSLGMPNGPHDPRPVMLRLERCKNIRLEGLRLHNPMTWATSFIECDCLWARSLDIDSCANHNGNGLCFDACEDVIVSDCHINTSDDGICLQSSTTEKPCARITVANCSISSGYAAIKIGMLSLGLIEQVTVTNCVFHNLGCSGVKIQSCEGGQLRRMRFSNLVIIDAPRPIFITLNRYRCGRNTPEQVPATGCVEDITFSGLRIHCSNNRMPNVNDGMIVTGIPEQKIKRITFHDVFCQMMGGIKNNDPNRIVPELTGQRAEYHAYGGIPASVFYIRHAEEVNTSDFTYSLCTDDIRTAVILDDARNCCVELRIDKPDE